MQLRGGRRRLLGLRRQGGFLDLGLRDRRLGLLISLLRGRCRLLRGRRRVGLPLPVLGRSRLGFCLELGFLLQQRGVRRLSSLLLPRQRGLGSLFGLDDGLEIGDFGLEFLDLCLNLREEWEGRGVSA